MAKDNFPVTPAIRFVKEKGIEYVPHQYEYSEKGGTKQTANELNVNENSVVKTLVLEAEKGEFIVLMHGDLEVSTKELARILDLKKIGMCSPEAAMKTTGYQFGGTSPFGTKKQLQIYAEETIFDLEKMYINGGKRGFILEMKPTELYKAFEVKKIKVGIIK